LSSRSSVRRGGIALADQFVASATNFLTGIIVGRVCAQEEFGLYLLGFSIVQVAIRLQTSLVYSPYMVFSPRLSLGEKAKYGGSTLLHQFGISALCVVVLILAGVALTIGVGPEGLTPVVWALACTMLFILLREYARNVYFAELRFTAALVLDATVSILQIGALLLLARFGLLNAGILFWTTGFACGLAGMVWLCKSRSSLAPQLARVVPDLGRNWGFGKWIFASSLVFDISAYSYPWILTYYHGPASTGVWAACFGAVAITNPIVIGMVNHIGPEIVHSFAAGGISALRRMVRKTNFAFLLLLAPLSVVLLLFGDWLVVLFYGEKYGGYGLVVSLLAVDIWMSPPRITLARALLAMERADVDFVTNFVPLAVVLVLGLWLVRAFGPLGVAWAILAGDLAATTAKFLAYSLLVRQRAGRARDVSREFGQ